MIGSYLWLIYLSMFVTSKCREYEAQMWIWTCWRDGEP